MSWVFTLYVHCIFYCSHRHQVAFTQTAMLQGKYCKAVILSFYSQYINLPWSLLKKKASSVCSTVAMFQLFCNLKGRIDWWKCPLHDCRLLWEEARKKVRLWQDKDEPFPP